MEEQVKKQEPVIETVTSFKPVRTRSEKQMANSILLDKNNVEFKRKKKERLLQELQDQQALQDQHDVATIEEIEEVKEQDKPTSWSDMAFIGLGLVAIIGCGVYCWYSSKAQSLTAKADTSKADTSKADTAKAVETVKSGIIDME